MIQATIAKVAATGSLLSGGSIVVAQAVPTIVPAGFQAWPATAMLAFIALVCLSIVVIMVKMIFKTMAAASEAQKEAAVAQMKLATELGETNTRMNEMSQKQGVTNEKMGELVAVIRAKPCIGDEDV